MRQTALVFDLHRGVTMEYTLIDFSRPDAVLPWLAIDDRVMGGASRSRMRHDAAGHAVFEGEVSFDNGGGFASVRNAEFVIEPPDVGALLLEVRGDGRRYKLNLRTDDGFDGINYQSAFEPPAGEWAVITLPLADFVPTFRGRALTDSPPLDATNVRQIGLLIGDRQRGVFALAVRRVGCRWSRG